MKTPVRFCLATGLALGLATSAFAQQQTVVPPPIITPNSPPTEVREIVFDWSAQRIVSDVVRPVTTPAIRSTASCFDNSSSYGSWSLFNNVADEIVDWGVKNCDQTDVIVNFTFSYKTYADDPSLGGPGAAMTWTLYEGTDGFGNLGTEVASFSFSGLPGTMNPGSPSWPTYYITVEFGKNPLVVPDGNIGWGYMNDDGQSGPVLALAPNATLGTRDALDVYTPGPATNGNYTGTFHWSGVFQASFLFLITEAPADLLAQTTIVNGSGVNPLLFSTITQPVLGSNWLSQVDISGYPNSPASVVAASPVPITPVLTWWGEALIDPTAPGYGLDYGYSLHSIQLPLWPDLAGLTYHTQAGIFLGGGSIVLTNGVDLTFGW